MTGPRRAWAWLLAVPVAIGAVVLVSCQPAGHVGPVAAGHDGPVAARHAPEAGPQHEATAGTAPDGHPVTAGAAHPDGDPDATSGAAPTTYSVLSARMLTVLDRRGPRAALRALDRAIERDPSVSGVCHAVAHDIGHAALALLDGDAAAALEVRDDVCGGGYTHGVVEMALADSTDIVADLRTVCAPGNDGSCFHGVGHGVMFATGYDVPASLDACDAAPDGILAIRCGEGVFMQLFTLDDGAGHMAPAGYQPATPASARRTCTDTRYPYSGPCWFYAPTVWLGLHPEDWAGVIAWCAKAPAGLGRETCTRGVGSRLVKYHPDDVPFAARTCASVPDRLLGDCLRGMGSYWSVHWKGQRPRADVCGRMGDARLEPLCREVNA